MTDTYRIKKSQYNSTDPSTYIDVEVGGIDTTTTDLTFVGRTREYGEQYNENVLHLLENFSSPEVEDTLAHSIFHAVPAFLGSPQNGQTWFNSSRKISYTYFRGRWIPQAYAGNAATNWGTVTSGVALPRPVGSDGYLFPYAECAWVISPCYLPEGHISLGCSVDPVTGVVTATYQDLDNVTQEFEVFYQIIGVRSNDYLSGSSVRVLVSTSLQQTQVPPLTAFPRTITSDVADRINVTVIGTDPANSIRYTWQRVFPSTTEGFPAGYIIEPTDSTSANTDFRIIVSSPGVFTNTLHVTKGATFVCLVEEVDPLDVVVTSKLGLPVRVEFSNFEI